MNIFSHYFGRFLELRRSGRLFRRDTILESLSRGRRADRVSDSLNRSLVDQARSELDVLLTQLGTSVQGLSDAEAEELRDQLQSLITDDQALRSLYRIAGGLDLTKLPLDGPMPELPLSNGAQGRQKILMDMARKENLTLRQAARRFAVGQAHQLICGTPETIADMMQEWFEKGACDGFCLMPCYYPRGIEAIVHLLIPELQRRGIFRKEYEGTTLRENLGLPMPQNRYTAAKAGGKQSVA